nr:hypothetical protein [uncultured Pseudodesulfovibrio sp.]
MKRRHSSRTMEWTRNILLILLAVIALVIFFNLDIMRHGDSVFTNSAKKQLKFSGALHYKDFTDKEIDRITDYIKVRKKLFKEIKIDAAPQDSYKKVSPSTQVLFEIHVTMADGFTFSTPVRRTQRAQLSKAIVSKLDKDVQAYLKLKKEGKNPTALINTM